MNRRDAIPAALALLALITVPRVIEAQPAGKVYRIGFLHAESPTPYYQKLFQVLRSGLQNLGYFEGKNLVLEVRWGNGKYDHLPDLAAELVHLKVDLLVTHGTKASLAAKRATASIPIVMAVTGDPVAYGLVASLARPGGNITGFSLVTSELNQKRLEMLRGVLPRITQVAFLLNPDNASSEGELKAMKTVAESLKLELQPFEVQGPNGFDSAFSAITKKRIDALVIQSDTMFTVSLKRIADFAAKKRIPSVGGAEFAQAGGLISYAPDSAELYRGTGILADKILKGAKPTDLPIAQPTTFELVVNLRTAKALGITFPQHVLLRADRVIE